MSDYIANKKVWLIGAGTMAIDYAKVLKAQNIDFDVIGRGVKSAKIFTQNTGSNVITGGLDQYLAQSNGLPTAVIVTVGVEHLAEITIKLIKYGVKRILVEKPAGIDAGQIQRVAEVAMTNNVEIYVAYNRRFYASAIKARQIIAEDGGVTSFNFEFTEWSHEIEHLKKAHGVKEAWFLANSTHVVDLAFFLGGEPKNISAYIKGGLAWHPSASVFAGAGVTEGGALFSYQANWAAPGRWGVEVLTNKHRLIFRPLEQLHVQRNGSVEIEKVEIDTQFDDQFKPGIYKQVQTFLVGDNTESLLTISEHCERVNRLFSAINYGNK
ncbi:Predicted dehydrogenase [Pelosinus fermentans]|uniref:Gfo/Idh/MocA family protein n=1 Tax=Pelosinus fermentans TaxID=365349 RepID=UPI0002685D9A|nr:Gfo/Idh/MocA family oxidoreductase [Pelosinus fermentans]OAM92787.1 oxidoreductase domain protein [Pelosinus fermentans DSM 17108]SDQ56846.1 Predicted dehydrogenase [Pelosinus fermentans]